MTTWIPFNKIKKMTTAATEETYIPFTNEDILKEYNLHVSNKDYQLFKKVPVRLWEGRTVLVTQPPERSGKYSENKFKVRITGFTDTTDDKRDPEHIRSVKVSPLDDEAIQFLMSPYQLNPLWASFNSDLYVLKCILESNDLTTFVGPPPRCPLMKTPETPSVSLPPFGAGPAKKLAGDKDTPPANERPRIPIIGIHTIKEKEPTTVPIPRMTLPNKLSPELIHKLERYRMAIENTEKVKRQEAEVQAQLEALGVKFHIKETATSAPVMETTVEPVSPVKITPPIAKTVPAAARTLPRKKAQAQLKSRSGDLSGTRYLALNKIIESLPQFQQRMWGLVLDQGMSEFTFKGLVNTTNAPKGSWERHGLFRAGSIIVESREFKTRYKMLGLKKGKGATTYQRRKA